MSKIVVLNSGGFDSIVLLHEVYDSYKNSTIHSLHFNYGEINSEEQDKCVDNVCKKLGVEDIRIQIPKLSWTKNKFYDNDKLEYESQYLEYRNLIFLSYAVSYAQSIGADKIYLAILKSHGYLDTTSEFISGLNTSIKQSGIEIIAPYKDIEKYDLWSTAKHFNISPTDFISCDLNRCGECGDCLATQGYIDYITPNTPSEVFNEYNTINDQFIDLFMNTELYEVRLLINNKCQLKCSHCFYGFDDMKSDQLTFEEMCSVIKQSIDIGVKSFHFSGKEPMIDDTIFKYADYIRSLDDTILYDVVTNGITIPKYCDKLVESGFKRVCLSVDDINNSNGVRSVSNVTNKALNCLKDTDIIVEVFIDLHENNYDKVDTIIDYLHKNFGVNRYFIRTIRNIGSANVHLTIDQLDVVLKSLVEYCCDNEEVDITFNVGSEYVYSVYEDKQSNLYTMLSEVVQKFNTTNILKNFSIVAEFYCNRYYNQITITPDGYVLGCGAEVSNPNYDILSSGNVRDNTIKDLFLEGKKKSMNLQCSKCTINGKYHLKNCPHLS